MEYSSKRQAVLLGLMSTAVIQLKIRLIEDEMMTVLDCGVSDVLRNKLSQGLREFSGNMRRHADL